MGWREDEKFTEIFEALDPEKSFLMRVNAGMAWAGKVVREYVKNKKRYIVIENPRPFHGVKEGVSDLIGFEVVEITPEMVGKKVAVFRGAEVKMSGGVSKEQTKFGEFLERMGAIFDVIR